MIWGDSLEVGLPRLLNDPKPVAMADSDQRGLLPTTRSQQRDEGWKAGGIGHFFTHVGAIEVAA